MFLYLLGFIQLKKHTYYVCELNSELIKFHCRAFSLLCVDLHTHSENSGILFFMNNSVSSKSQAKVFVFSIFFYFHPAHFHMI